MTADFLFDLLRSHGSKVFLIDDEKSYLYSDLLTALQNNAFLKPLPSSEVVVLESENTFAAYVKLLALLGSRRPFLVCPDYQFNDSAYRYFLETELESNLVFSPKHSPLPAPCPDNKRLHYLIIQNLQKQISQFIVRTSGSSGKKFKFILHSADLFFNKYRKIGPHFEKTFAFSPLESIAGIETLLEVVFHGKILVTTAQRTNPKIVAEAIRNHGVTYFQTTPTFLNLMALSGQLTEANFSGLKKIAYGSEPALLNTLVGIQKVAPLADLMHTYGMSEIGIQKTVTNPENPIFFKLDPNFNPGQNRAGLLEVLSLTPLLGYLNHDNCTDAYFPTGDTVEEKDTYIRVLGRQGDLINVAGRKFFPFELETLIAGLPDVADVAVIREDNSLIGSVVVAKIFLSPQADQTDFRRKLKLFCEQQVPYFMHPQKIVFTDAPLTNSRHKKVRTL